jgi:ribosome maturation protein SDO1
MVNTLARIKKAGKNFEIIVDLENALKFKEGKSNFIEAEGDKIFTDSKKGHVPSNSDLQEAFGTTEINEIIHKIVKNGQIQTTQEHREAEQEKKFKQIIDFLSKNAIDPQTGNPITSERIKNAIEQANINIKNIAIENQINDILAKINNVIPIKLNTKKVRIIIPAIYTGKVYGIFSQYKENEKWLDNGDLEVEVKVPSGIIIDFYEKLNNITHGSAITEEIEK